MKRPFVQQRARPPFSGGRRQPISNSSPEPDFSMVRAASLLGPTLVCLAGVLAPEAGWATGPGAQDGGRRVTTTFNLVYAATAPREPTVTPGAGASVPPKAVVSNPYHVPLIQNAGSLGSVR